MPRRQPRWPSIGLNSCSSAARRLSVIDADPDGLGQLGEFGVGVRQEFVERRIEQADRYRQAAMTSKIPAKSARCSGSSLASAARRSGLVFGQDHLAHSGDPAGVKEHVLGAAQARPPRRQTGAQCGNRPGFRHWCALSCGGACQPSPSTRAEIADQLGLDGRHLARPSHRPVAPSRVMTDRLP
jgi:hypothetical protein